MDRKENIEAVGKRRKVKKVEELYHEILAKKADKFQELQWLLGALHLEMGTRIDHCGHDLNMESELSARVQLWIDNRWADKRAAKMLWIGILSAVAAAFSALCAYVALTRIPK